MQVSRPNFKDVDGRDKPGHDQIERLFDAIML
jgi:hypothetical protein